MLVKESRKCRKCGELIPWTLRENGKTRNLGNRKFCLKCSPWRGHNTKVDVDKINTRKLPYEQWDNKVKKQIQANNYRRGQQRKKDLVKMSGDCCSVCGYNKSLNALSFHHRNPEEKKIQLALNSLAQNTWEVILEEWKKCDLLCANCHAERHDRGVNLPDKVEKIVKGSKKKVMAEERESLF